MGWRNNIFKFLPIKYVNSHEMALGMSMLACFWGGNLYNLFGKHKPKWGARKLWISEARQSLSLPHQMYQKIEENEYKILEKKINYSKNKSGSSFGHHFIYNVGMSGHCLEHNMGRSKYPCKEAIQEGCPHVSKLSWETVSTN